MTNAIATIIRNRETGAAVSGVTVEYRDHDTDSLIDSTTTDANGLAAFSETEAGYPGQWYITADDGANTYVISSKVIGQIGPWRAIDFVRFMRLMGDGVIDGLGAELACSADGVGMNVDVQDGGALGRGGIYYWPVDQSVTLANADGTNPRIDRIVLRFYGPETTDPDNAGKIVLDKLTGTPAASPAAPALTQSDSTYWEISLAQVLVDAGVTSIASNKVTDERSFTVAPVLDGSITYEKIASADLGTGAGQLAIGDHSHITETKRGYLHDEDGATTATTTSTTNVDSTVQAFSFTFTLPAGTWKVQAKFELDVKHSGDGQVRIATDWDAANEETDDYFAYSDHHKTLRIKREETGVAAGAHTIRGRYCCHTSGTAQARSPYIEVNAWRTA